MAVAAPPHHPESPGEHRTGPLRSAHRRGQAARSATATDLRRHCRRDRRRRRGNHGYRRFRHHPQRTVRARHSRQAPPPTAPTGELVASMHLWQPPWARRCLALPVRRWTADLASGGWVERRLTPDAVARVQDELISTGLFDPDRRPPGSQGPACSHMTFKFAMATGSSTCPCGRPDLDTGVRSARRASGNPPVVASRDSLGTTRGHALRPGPLRDLHVRPWRRRRLRCTAAATRTGRRPAPAPRLGRRAPRHRQPRVVERNDA